MVTCYKKNRTKDHDYFPQFPQKVFFKRNLISQRENIHPANSKKFILQMKIMKIKLIFYVKNYEDRFSKLNLYKMLKNEKKFHKIKLIRNISTIQTELFKAYQNIPHPTRCCSNSSANIKLVEMFMAKIKIKNHMTIFGLMKQSLMITQSLEFLYSRPFYKCCCISKASHFLILVSSL